MDIFQAEGFAAGAAPEVDVGIVVVVLAVAVAELVTQSVATAVEGMDQMALAKERQRAGYHAFVHAAKGRLYFAHGQGSAGAPDGVCNENAVGGGLDTVVHHQVYDIVGFHR